MMNMPTVMPRQCRAIFPPIAACMMPNATVSNESHTTALRILLRRMVRRSRVGTRDLISIRGKEMYWRVKLIQYPSPL